MKFHHQQLKQNIIRISLISCMVVLAVTVYAHENSFHTDTLGVDRESTQEELVDRDGNRHKTVKIGTQVWMAENLKTSTLNNGTPIIKVIDKGTWKTTTAPAFCFYDDSETNKKLYGALYNWYSVETTLSGWLACSYCGRFR